MSSEAAALAVRVVVIVSVEAGFLWVAASHARRRAWPRLTLWATRVGLAGTVIASVGGAYSAWWEATTYDYPWTLPGKPLGTYEQPTGAGMLEVAVWSSLFGIAAIVAAFRPRLGAGMLIVVALGVFLGTLGMLIFDDTFPDTNLLQATLIIVFPGLVVAALVWSLGRSAIRRG